MSVVTEQSADLDLWAEYIERRCGMSFTSRRRVLAACLQERMRVGGFRTLLEYYHAVSAQPAGHPEWTTLFGLFLNGETKFFRDAAAFQALQQTVLPELARQVQQGHHEPVIRLWSAGCSTGQEVYSLAIACREHTTSGAIRTEVLGTDVSETNLMRASTGKYRSFETRGLRDEHRRRHFVAEGDDIRMADVLRERVTFQRLDLTSAEYRLPKQDVIFCQNVLIYYTPEARAEIVHKLVETLTPGGYLFLGAAEGLGLSTPGVDLVRLDEAWAYRRRQDSPPRDLRERASNP